MTPGLLPLASPLAVFAAFLTFPFLSNSYPIIPKSNFSPTLALNLRSSEKCGFVGNNDIYGIGIRIGIYTQIFAVWFANYFLLSQAQILRDSITVFTVALLALSLMFVYSPSSSYAAEANILFGVLSWSCIIGVRAKTRFSKLTFRVTIRRQSLVRRSISAALHSNYGSGGAVLIIC